MKTYVPHKFQAEFHKSDARFRTLIAGRRGGKTLAGTIEALWYADKNPKSRGWIVAPTYVMLRDVNIPMVLEYLPDHAVENWNRSEKRIELINGAEIVFRSAEDPDKLRGIGLNWVWLDEASFMKKEVWDVLYPTLTDTKGVGWVTTTPQGYDWVHKTFFVPAQEDHPDYEVWRYKTLDSPYVDPEMVEKARKEMSAQMFRQEYEAEFEHFTGLVYPDFSEKEHVIHPKSLDRDDLWFVGIDVGYTNPTAAILICEDIKNRVYIVDEVYEAGMTVPEIARRIKQMVGDRNVEAYVIDSSSKGKSQAAAAFSDLSVADQFIENGIPVTMGTKDVIGGINRVTQKIKNGELFVYENCENVIREFENYSWPRTKDDMSNKDERPTKAFDHAMDAVRYVVMTRPEVFERQKRDWYGRPIEQDSIDFIEDGDSVVDLI